MLRGVPSPATLLAVLLASAVGTGYLVYGKRQQRAAPMLAGAALCVYPYFFDSLWALVLIGLGLALVPFLVD